MSDRSTDTQFSSNWPPTPTVAIRRAHVISPELPADSTSFTDFGRSKRPAIQPSSTLHNGGNHVGGCDIPDEEHRPPGSGVMSTKWKDADLDQWFESHLSGEGEQRRAEHTTKLSQQMHDTDRALYQHEVPHRLLQDSRDEILARTRRTQADTNPYEKSSLWLSDMMNGEAKEVPEEIPTCLQGTNPDQLDVEIEITRLFKKWLKQCFKTRTSHADSCAGGQSAPPGLSGGRRAQDPRNRKRSGKSHDYGCNGEDEGDESNQNPAKKKRRGSHGDRKRLGCPFFKHNPDNHRQYPSCCGQGFWNTHDMKTHLYRCHTPPEFRCFRCYKPFDDETSCKDHCRNITCSKEDPPMAEIEGVTRDMYKRIKPRSPNGVTEYQRWIDVYLILFPDTERDAIPSPYAGVDEPHVLPGERGSCSHHCSFLDDPELLERFLLRECPQHVRDYLRMHNFPRTATSSEIQSFDLLHIFLKLLIRLIDALKEQSRREAATSDAQGAFQRNRGIATSASVTAAPLEGAHAAAEAQDMETFGCSLGTDFTVPPVPPDLFGTIEYLAHTDYDEIDLDEMLHDPLATQLPHSDDNPDPLPLLTSGSDSESLANVPLGMAAGVPPLSQEDHEEEWPLLVTTKVNCPQKPSPIFDPLVTLADGVDAEMCSFNADGDCTLSDVSVD